MSKAQMTRCLLVTLAVIILAQAVPTRVDGVAVVKSTDPNNPSPMWKPGTPRYICLPCDPNVKRELEVMFQYKWARNERATTIKGKWTSKSTGSRKVGEETDWPIPEPPPQQGTIIRKFTVWCTTPCEVRGPKGIVGAPSAVIEATVGNAPVQGRAKNSRGNYVLADGKITVYCCPELDEPVIPGDTYCYLEPTQGTPGGKVIVSGGMSDSIACQLSDVDSMALKLTFSDYVTPLAVQPDSFFATHFDSLWYDIVEDTVYFYGLHGHSIAPDTTATEFDMYAILANVEDYAPLLESQPVNIDSLDSGFWDEYGDPLEGVDWAHGEVFVAPEDDIAPVISEESVVFGDSIITGLPGAVSDNMSGIPGWVAIGVDEYCDEEPDGPLWLGVDWTLVDSLGEFTLVQPMDMDSAFVLRLVAEDLWGNADTLIYEHDLSAVDPAAGTVGPAAFGLAQNRPNPFHRATEIRYDLPVDCEVRLEVYDVLGRSVKVLVDEYQKAGSQTVVWDLSSPGEDGISCGIYFYRLHAGSYRAIRKMVLSK